MDRAELIAVGGVAVAVIAIVWIVRRRKPAAAVWVPDLTDANGLAAGYQQPSGQHAVQPNQPAWVTPSFPGGMVDELGNQLDDETGLGLVSV